MPLVDEGEEGVGGSGLVVALLHLAETDVVDDEQLGCGPAVESLRVRAVGETGVEIVEQVPAHGVADRHLLLAGAERQRLHDVALPGAGLAGDDQVFGVADEVETGELEDESLVERGLEGPVEDLERLALGETAGRDAAFDSAGELVRGLFAEDALEQDAGRGVLTSRPGEMPVDVFAGVGES